MDQSTNKYLWNLDNTIKIIFSEVWDNYVYSLLYLNILGPL